MVRKYLSLVVAIMIVFNSCIVLADGGFVLPLDSKVVTSKFGVRNHPVTKEPDTYHTGCDYRAAIGTDVKSILDGTITYSGVMSSYGNLVKISHNNGLESYYAHNDELLCSVGDVVLAGQVIAKSGNTGRVTGPHLHLEIRKNNIPIDPELIFNGKNVDEAYNIALENKKAFDNFKAEKIKDEVIQEFKPMEKPVDNTIEKSKTEIKSEYLYQKALFNGYEDGTINPDGFITREEFATIVERLLDSKESSDIILPFSDIEENRWSYNALKTLYVKGIMTGHDNGTMQPRVKITRAQAVAMVSRVKGVDIKVEDGKSWSDSMIAYGLNNNWITNNQDGFMTRGEIAYLINIAYGRYTVKDFNSNKVNGFNGFKDLNSSHKYYKVLMTEGHNVMVELKNDEVVNVSTFK